MKTDRFLPNLMALQAAIGLLFLSLSTTLVADENAKPDSPAASGPSDADYCTILYADKLKTDLKLSDVQREKAGESRDRLKSMLENAANPGAAHGPANTRARTLAKRGGTVLSRIGPEVRHLLTRSMPATFLACARAEKSHKGSARKS